MRGMVYHALFALSSPQMANLSEVYLANISQNQRLPALDRFCQYAILLSKLR